MLKGFLFILLFNIFLFASATPRLDSLEAKIIQLQENAEPLDGVELNILKLQKKQVSIFKTLYSVQVENSRLKKELQEQLNNSKVKDKEIEYLKNSIENLESRLNNNLVNVKTYDIKIDSFDKRISDINISLVGWGTLITLFMVFIVFKSKQEAKLAIQEWINEEAEDELKSKIDKHIEHDKKEYISGLIEEKIEKSVSIEIKELKAIIEDLKNKGKESKAELENIKKIGKEAQNTLQEIQVSKEDIETSEKVPMQKRTDEDYYNLGAESLNNRSYNEAIFNFEQALKHHDKFAKDKIYFALGFAYGEHKEYHKAINAYQKAIDINPQKDMAYNNMGVAYYNLKKFDAVIECCKEAIHINVNNSLAYINLFELQLTQNQTFDQELEKQYLELFSNNKESKINYDMLKVFENISKGKESGLYEWLQEYNGISLGGWSFDELKEWINGYKDNSIKAELLKALEVFEKREA